MYTYQQLIEFLAAGKVSVNQRYSNKTYMLTGDADPLEYGAMYVSGESFGAHGASFTINRFTGRDWDGYTSQQLYAVLESCIDFDDLVRRWEDYKDYSGLDDDQGDLVDLNNGIARILESAASYGVCSGETPTGKNAKNLLGHSVHKNYIPNDYFLLA